MKNWDLDIILEKLKTEKIDYRNLMDLNLFNSDIRPLEEKWNSYDNFNEETLAELFSYFILENKHQNFNYLITS